MIRVNLTLFSLSVTGHSRSAGKGEDLVCCAVTTLTNALVFGLREVLGMDVKIAKWEEGAVEVSWNPAEILNGAAAGTSLEARQARGALIATIYGSLRELAARHADFLDVAAHDDIIAG